MEAEETKILKYVQTTVKIKTHLHLQSAFKLHHVQDCVIASALMGYPCIIDL